MSKEEFDFNQQVEAYHAQVRAEQQAAQAEREKQMNEARQARARGETIKFTPPPTLGEMYRAKTAETIAAQEAAEAARIAAIPQRDRLISALPLETRRHIQRYEEINKMPFPLEVLGLHG